MCGIAGYTGIKNASEKVYSGLLRLEYRGYDSAGICCADGGKFNVVKRVGAVATLSPYVSQIKGRMGIGHTRWATHGGVCQDNAHPHLSEHFAVVHNGIIENYAPLKAWLSGLGAQFRSATDSEVVAHLLEHYYLQERDFLRAVRLAISRLKGAFALLILCVESDFLCAVKHESPLLVGKGTDGSYAGSDPVALVDGCESAYRLKDGEIALLSATEIVLVDDKDEKVAPTFEKLDLDCSSVDSCGFEHYMLKEIGECPRTVLDSAKSYFDEHEKDVKKIVAGIDKIMIVGCGTAFNAGLVGKRFFEDIARVPTSVEIASEIRYANPVADGNTLIIAISQSGETADTIEATKSLKNLGARVLALTCVKHSALATIADCVVHVRSGKEICVAATKSYCGQVACLYCICSTIARFGGALESLQCVSGTMREITTLQPQIKSLASRCIKKRAIFFLGRGNDFAVAEEASLKLKEVSYIFCDGYACGELKHGTLALVDENTLSVVIISDEKNAGKCLNTIEQISSRKGEVAVISTLSNLTDGLPSGVETITLPNCLGALSPLITATALMYLAYYSATQRGLNPDKPRNLAKSVTVE